MIFFEKNTKVKHKILEIIGLFLVIGVFFFQFKISYNEMDVIPYAKATFNNNWLPNDWYLNLKITYRYLFSYTVGFFIETFGITKTIIVGRLFSYFLISLSIQRLLWIINNKSYNIISYLALILFFNFFKYGNGAGEWMVGGLETKVFAYAFSILAMTMFIEKRMKLSFLFSGLALSFHLLVGIYSLFCLIPIFFFNQRSNNKFYRDIIKALPFFIITGSLGIYGVLNRLFSLGSSSSNLGWDIYVNLRVPHHTLPLFFPLDFWIKTLVFTVINIIFVIKIRNPKIKLISYYALFSVIISLIGLIIFWTSGANHNLKYYFFRYSDIILPFITLLNISYFIHKIKKHHQKTQNVLNLIVLVIIIFFTTPKTKNFTKKLISNSTKFKTYTSDDITMENWIKNNTKNNSTFIAPPNMAFFYINFERPVFVTWKHSPQSEPDIVEWHHKLKLLNKNKDFKNKTEVFNNYYKLTEKDIIEIAEKYPNTNYFITSSEINLNLPMLFKTDKFTLYETRTLTDKTY